MSGQYRAQKAHPTSPPTISGLNTDTSPLSIFVTLHHHHHHNLMLGAMQCASSAMIAPLLRSCSLSLSLARCWLCAVQATPIIGCANGCLCVPKCICMCESQRVIGPALQAATLRRCRRRRMHIHKRASSVSIVRICVCVCVCVGVGVRCVFVCVRIFRLISIFRSARFQAKDIFSIFPFFCQKIYYCCSLNPVSLSYYVCVCVCAWVWFKCR